MASNQYNVPIYNFRPDKNPTSPLTSLEACLYDAVNSDEQGDDTPQFAFIKPQEELFAKLPKTGSIEQMLAIYAKLKDKAGKPKNTRGYIRKSDADTLTITTSTIPANFAGLEAVDVPTRLEEQLFRVVEVEEDEDYVTITARHVWYDNLQNYTMWKPVETTKYTAGDVCRNVLSNAVSPCASRVATDCKDEIIGKDLDFERKNLVEAFLDPEKGICAKYGLSLIRDNWDFYCLKNVGYNRGFVIQNGKNLLGVTRKESIENLVTRIVPFAKSEKGDELVWMNNNGSKWLDSDDIGDYSYPRVELYDTGLQIGKDGVTAQNVQAKLLEAAQKHYTDDKVDIPTIEMTIEFISLGDTEEYEQYRGLDKVYLYDIITVVDTIRGYSHTAQVVGVEHDLLTGMLLSVTIGELDNWDGKRKVATWQVPEINGDNIRLKSIIAGAYADGSIFGNAIADGGVRWVHIDAASIDQLTTEQLDALNANIKTLIAGSITADDIEAGSITADRIDVEDLAAAFIDVNVLNAAIAAIAEAEIGSANISFAQIKDASVDNLIAHDAVTDKYYIDKLAVRSAQMVQATVGELIIKAADNHYYRLDIDQYGALSPTDVTNDLTSAEKTAGETSDGHSAIIETDLTVGDLSASNMKAINALIDKITASRIDVQELFARQATITQLNTVDIRGNTYLQLMVQGYGTTYEQWTDPASVTGNTVKDGDVWYKGFPLTWAEAEDYTWADLESYTWAGVEGYVQYIRKDGAWVEVSDPMDVQHNIAMIALENDKMALRVEDSWEGVARLSIEASLLEARVQDNEGNIAALTIQANQLLLAVGNKYDVISGIAIALAGIAMTGSKYIKLDVNSGNYVHIDDSGIDVKGNKIKVNGRNVFDRDDIIIMRPNDTDSWRRTVAGIESHMAGQHDWVMIRPFYDASINYVGASGGTQTQNVITNQYTESGSSGKAFGGQADWYQYVVTLNLYNGASAYRALNVQVYLSNKPFSLSPNGDRRSEAAAQANVILPEVTGTIGAGGTLTLTLDSGHVGYNLCGENQKLYYYIYGLNYEGLNISSQGMVATTDTTNGRVACTTYYYP